MAGLKEGYSRSVALPSGGWTIVWDDRIISRSLPCFSPRKGSPPMPRIEVLVEVLSPHADAFSMHLEAMQSEGETVRQGERLLAPLDKLSGLGLEILGDFPPVPMFSTDSESLEALSLSTLALSDPD